MRGNGRHRVSNPRAAARTENDLDTPPCPARTVHRRDKGGGDDVLALGGVIAGEKAGAAAAALVAHNGRQVDRLQVGDGDAARAVALKGVVQQHVAVEGVALGLWAGQAMGGDAAVVGVVGAPDGLGQRKAVALALVGEVGLARVVVGEVRRVVRLVKFWEGRGNRGEGQRRDGAVHATRAEGSGAQEKRTRVSRAINLASAAEPTPWLMPMVFLVFFQKATASLKLLWARNSECGS